MLFYPFALYQLISLGKEKVKAYLWDTKTPSFIPVRSGVGNSNMSPPTLCHASTPMYFGQAHLGIELIKYVAVSSPEAKQFLMQVR